MAEPVGQRFALAEALAKLAHGVAKASDDQEPDQGAADDVWRRIELLAARGLDREGRRVDQQRCGQGDDPATADVPNVD